MIGKSLVALALASSAMGVSILTAPLVVPDVFKPVGTAVDSHAVTFTLHLNSPRYNELLSRTEQISKTGGAWLKTEELEQYMRPAAADSDAVKKYLASKGIPDSAITFSPFGEDVKVTTTVAQAKQVFPDTTFSLFNYKSKSLVRSHKVHVPNAISDAILHVGGLVDFPNVRRMAPVTVESTTETLDKRADGTDCDISKVTPSCLRHYYGTIDYQPSQSNGVDISIMGYIGQYVSQSDLTSFLQKYRSDAADYQIPIVLAAGGINDESNPGTEAMLDVDTVLGVTGKDLNVNFVSYSTPDAPGDIFSDSFGYFIDGDGSQQRPSIISISYGADESDITPEQAEVMCQKATQLSALGTTIVVSSGDDGVAGNGQNACDGGSSSPFIPTYPGGCPAIASIGATTAFNPEVMVKRFQSGAARSNYFSIPDYQSQQVAAYDQELDSTTTPPGSFNSTGRSFPDYVATGDRNVVISGGRELLVGGTSASAPAIAAIFGLLNNALQAAGKSNLGYSQPKLYPIANAFNDIDSGISAGCGSDKTLGFPAKPGFDGASGIGSPKFSDIRQALGA